MEAYENTDNTSAARSAACIALYPIGNAAGSWTLWKLDSNCTVQRTRYVKLVTTDTVIDKVNRIAESEVNNCEVIMKAIELEMVADTNTDEEIMADETKGVSDSANSEGAGEPEIPEDKPEGQVAVRTSSGRIISKPSRFLGVTTVPKQDVKAAETSNAIST